jgi:hypothetical protein
MLQDKPDKPEWLWWHGQPIIRAVKVEFHTHRPKSSWQQERVIRRLAEIFPTGVPDQCLRKWLLAALIRRDPDLERLNWKTLQRAIKQHNSLVAELRFVGS